MTFFQTRSGDFVGAPPRGRSPPDTRCAGPARVYKSLRFQTFSPISNWIHFSIQLTVSGGKKEFLKIFTLKPTRGLAYWFIDDGSSSNNNRTYRFSTQSFQVPKGPASFLGPINIEALKDNFDGLMAATIHKHRSY